eukprot:scaffold61947_cov63-Attheya_sp.AAC.8
MSSKSLLSAMLADSSASSLQAQGTGKKLFLHCLQLQGGQEYETEQKVQDEAEEMKKNVDQVLPALLVMTLPHLPPATCHLPPVTCHLSPVTCHLPPATSITSSRVRVVDDSSKLVIDI